MTAWSMRFDMRMPEFLTTTAADQYQAALELCSYADEHGCSSIMVSEHHQSEDGYLPDALMMAMAIAAVTKNTCSRSEPSSCRCTIRSERQNAPRCSTS